MVVAEVCTWTSGETLLSEKKRLLFDEWACMQIDKAAAANFAIGDIRHVSAV